MSNYTLTLNVSHALASRAKTDADAAARTLRAMIEASTDVRSAKVAKVAQTVHLVAVTFAEDSEQAAVATARVALAEVGESHDSVSLRNARTHVPITL